MTRVPGTDQRLTRGDRQLDDIVWPKALNKDAMSVMASAWSSVPQALNALHNDAVVFCGVDGAVARYVYDDIVREWQLQDDDTVVIPAAMLATLKRIALPPLAPVPDIAQPGDIATLDALDELA